MNHNDDTSKTIDHEDEDDCCFFPDIFDDENRVESDHYIYFSVCLSHQTTTFYYNGDMILLLCSQLLARSTKKDHEEECLTLISTRYTSRDENTNDTDVLEVCWLSQSTTPSQAEQAANSSAEEFCRLWNNHNHHQHESTRMRTASRSINLISAQQQQQQKQHSATFHCEPLRHDCEIPLLEPPPPCMDLTIIMMDDDDDNHNSNDTNTNKSKHEDAALSAFRRHGFVVVSASNHSINENSIPTTASDSSTMISQLRDIVMPHVIDMLDKVDQIKRLHPTQFIKFQEVMQRGIGRFDMNLSTLPGLHELFASAARRPFWWPLVQQILDRNQQQQQEEPAGGCRLVQMGVVVSRGGCNAPAPPASVDDTTANNSSHPSSQYWHADGPESLEPYQGLCVFIPLISLDDTTGYTSFWSGTHLQSQQSLLTNKITDKMPYFYRGKLQQQQQQQQNAAAAADDDGQCINVDENSSGGCCRVLLYDYKVIHRGEANHMPRTTDLRPIFYLVYGTEEFKERNFLTTTSIEAMLPK